MKPTFKRKILKNGMTLLFEKRDIPVVSVAFAVRHGGINEIESEKGISHFIEHMLYKGTPTRDAKKIAEDIEKNGGELNGFTSEEITAFYCKMPSENLKIGLDVLSDLVKNPLFDEVELEKERKVIFEEIKMYKDNPIMHVFTEIHQCLFEKPFGISIAGTYEAMNSLDRKKLVERFRQVYTSDNLIFCVVGDADFNSLVKFAEKTFSKEKFAKTNFPRKLQTSQKEHFENSSEKEKNRNYSNFSKQKSKKFYVPIKSRNEIKIESREGIDQANLIFAHHTYLSDNPKSYSAFVLNVLMAGGMSSKLFSEIREKQNLAYAVKGESTSSKDFAYNLVYVGTTKENVEKVKKIIIHEFEKVSKDLDEKELNEIKKQIIGNYKISMEDSQSQMVHLLSYEIQGNASEFYEFEDKIKKVKLKDVKELAGKAVKEYSFYALVPSN
jgi:predicted Zn-dependent peptidase